MIRCVWRNYLKEWFYGRVEEIRLWGVEKVYKKKREREEVL